jgi:hypothetical protein
VETIVTDYLDGHGPREELRVTLHGYHQATIPVHRSAADPALLDDATLAALTAALPMPLADLGPCLWALAAVEED